MCLDQGPLPGHTPIAYGCHYYGPQVRTAFNISVSLRSPQQRLYSDITVSGNLVPFFIFKHTFYRSTGELYIGGIKSHNYNNNRCLADVGNKETVPGLYNCKEAMQKGMGIYWDFRQVLQKSIITGWIWDGWFGLKYHLERWCGGVAALMTCVFFPGQRTEEQTDKKVPWDKK